MRVEILHIDDCPNTAKAGDAARAALDAIGLADIAVEFVLLTTPEAARETPFAGSPTIAADGRDLFPSDGATESLACRVYPTPSGLAGVPTVEQLVEALRGRASGS
ncbi:hypothetical protein [Agromyces sp. NPDC056965]|uniref:hypothetical protein n=1 Tax=Agromyces sp. NPDC056965 TaxID=3345983 RepID=UPI003629F476